MKKFDRGRIKVVRRMHVRESSSENWGLDETARRRGGMKVRRMNVSKALRQWMQAQHQWHDPSYRNNDFGVPGPGLNASQRRRLASHHQHFRGWVPYHQTIFAELQNRFPVSTWRKEGQAGYLDEVPVTLGLKEPPTGHRRMLPTILLQRGS